MKIHPISRLAALALCLGASAWGFSASAADTITVGFAISQTGFMAQYDVPNANAAIMQIEKINAKGGLLGKQIKYVMRDVRSNVQESSKVGAEIAQMGVDLMVVSGDFDIGAPAAIMAQKAKIVSFSLSAADPKMGVATGPYSFSANGAAQSEGILMSEWDNAVQEARDVLTRRWGEGALLLTGAPARNLVPRRAALGLPRKCCHAKIPSGGFSAGVPPGRR